MRFVINAQGVEQVLDGEAGVGAALVPQEHLGHAVRHAAGLLAPGVEQELEQAVLVLASGLEVAHVDGAAGVVVADVAPHLEPHLVHAGGLVLVELLVAHDRLPLRRVVDEAERGVDLVQVVGMQAAQGDVVARGGLRLGIHAGGAQQRVDAAFGDGHVDAVGVRDVHGHRRGQCGLAVATDAFALGRRDEVQRFLGQRRGARVGALLAAGAVARVVAQPGIDGGGFLPMRLAKRCTSSVAEPCGAAAMRSRRANSSCSRSGAS